ncbi:MAG: hypothetical protein K2X87_00800 [Gemmataceae bacterium]|nr:hypothetical protein [Gemmataceae bacterium]
MAHTTPPRRPVLLSFRFAGPALVGSLVMGLVSAFAPPAAQVAVLGALVSILAGLFFAYLEQEDDRDRRRAELLERLAVPLAHAPEHDLYDGYLAFCRALTELARRDDPALREIAALKLAAVNAQLDALAAGTAVFAGTEAWRTVYEKLLASPDVREYRSVAWARAADYWQDPPGRQSLRANLAAADRGVFIERVIILSDALWPAGASLPADAVRPWVEEQHAAGLRVHLAREADVRGEPDLLGDFGVYGDRAVGTLELDDRARPVRFTLSVDRQAVRLARDRWDRLALFAVPYRDLLARTEGPA